MSDDGCAHRTAADFRVPGAVVVDAAGVERRVWRCSVCGAEDAWRDGWAYYGKDECALCGRAVVELVLCPACYGRVSGRRVG